LNIENQQSEDQPDQNVADLQKEHLEEALREKDQFRAMAQRSQADLDNYKKRVAEEMTELKNSATSRLLLRLLSIIDDLNRAVSMIPDDAVVPGWLEGIKLVQRNIDHILETEGVTKIEAIGRQFEPWEFEAVQYQEASNSDDGSIIGVVRDGYKQHDKLLRAAQVIVAKKPDTTVESKTTEEESE